MTLSLEIEVPSRILKCVATVIGDRGRSSVREVVYIGTYYTLQACIPRSGVTSLAGGDGARKLYPLQYALEILTTALLSVVKLVMFYLAISSRYVRTQDEAKEI